MLFRSIRDYHPLWFNFPVDSTSWNISRRGPTTPILPKQDWFGLFRFRSPLLSESLIIFSSSGYLDVSVPQVPLSYLCVQYEIREVRSRGFPHSEIPGSKPIRSSPGLIATYYVLLRLLMPRHPPNALLILKKTDSLN